MAGCWKKGGQTQSRMKDNENGEDAVASSSSRHRNRKPIWTGFKHHRYRRSKRARHKKRGKMHFSVRLEDDDDEDEDDLFERTASSSQIAVASSSNSGSCGCRRGRIKRMLLCGRGVHCSDPETEAYQHDPAGPSVELSPTLVAAILNWHHFNAELLMMTSASAGYCSDGELQDKEIYRQRQRASASMAAPPAPLVKDRRRQSLAPNLDRHRSVLAMGNQKNPSLTSIEPMIAASPEALLLTSSSALARRRLQNVSPKAAQAVILTNNDGVSEEKIQRRGALLDDDEEEIKKAITRSPLPLARTNAQLDLFANLNKERASRYWSETAAAGEHIWIATGASTQCYIGEMDCSKVGGKLKCAACHVIVHEGCLPLLRRMNFNCKLTYREAQGRCQKEQPFIVHHHWVHKWRQEGRCKACGKSFQSKFLNRELVSIACSWCKMAYHNKHGCFTMKQIEETCAMGPLKDVIIPPSWVFKLPPRRISTIRKRHPLNNISVKRRRRSRKVASDRLYVARPQPPLDVVPRTPVLVFVNPRSGGNKGAKIFHTLQWLVNPRQVFDVAAMGGPRYGLEMYRKLLPRLRVLVCGGDGTVGWLLSTLDALKWPVYPAIGIVPLGTGNDLARTLGWGATYADEPMSELLIAMADETVVTQLDRWSIEVTANMDAECDTDCDDGVVPQLPLSVMNNYFSIGADAQVALQFHESRSANPDVFNSRLKNRLFYGGIGTMDLFKRTWRDLSEHISLYCDGVDMTCKVQELKLHCLLFLNIPRYAGGTLPWGSAIQQPGGSGTNAAAASTGNSHTGGQQPAAASSLPAGQGSPPHSPQFLPPSVSDGRMEVLGFTSATLAALQVGGRGERIAQCSEIKIITRKAIPAQVDGEPCKLAPSVIVMRFHSKVPILQRVPCKVGSRRGSGTASLINYDSACGTPALHTSVLLRLPVAAIGKENYDAYKQDAVQLRAAGILASTLMKKIESRYLVMAGSIVSAVGLAASSLAYNYAHMIICLSILNAVGQSFARCLLPVAAAHSFDERMRHVAMAITSVGDGVGGLIFPLLFQHLISQWHWRGALVITAGIALQLVVCGAVVNEHLQKSTKVSLIDDPTLRATSAVARIRRQAYRKCFELCPNAGLLYANVLAHSIGYSIFMTFLFPELTETQGISGPMTSYVLACVGGVSIFGRVSVSWMDNKRVPRWLIYAIFHIVRGLVVICYNAVPSLASTQSRLIAYFVLTSAFGMTDGITGALIPVVGLDLFGLQKLADIYGCQLFFIGVGSVIGAPIAATLKPLSSSQLPFTFSGISFIVAGLVLLPLFITKKHYQLTAEEKCEVQMVDLKQT